MGKLVEVLLVNACAATLLAGVALLVGGFVKRPAVVHLLWVLVLLKLLAPPLIGVPAIPHRTAEPIRSELAARGSLLPPFELVPQSESAAHDRVRSAVRIAVGAALALWIVGGIGLLILTGLRARRFQRHLASSRPAPARIRRRAEQLALALGIASPPPVRLVDGRLPPMLWCRRGRCELLFPSRLLGSLDAHETDAILAHELAHHRRKDHWIRYLEVSCSALFWWHPVVWLARRGLRGAEEQSCDALVLQALPGRSRAYAEGLLKTLSFLSGSESQVPLLATGASAVRHLKERLTMIMRNELPGTLAPLQRWALAALALGALAIFPTWADRARAEDEGEERAASVDVAAREDLMELRRRAIELEEELKHVRSRQLEIERAIELDRARARGLQSEVEQVEEDAALRRDDIERARIALQVSKMEQMVERLHHEGRDEEAAELVEQIARLRGETRQRRARMDLDRIRVEFDDLRKLREELQSRGESIEAAELEQRMRALELEATAVEMREENDRRRADLARMRAERERRLEGLSEPASAGDEKRVQQLAEELREIDAELERLRTEQTTRGPW